MSIKNEAPKAVARCPGLSWDDLVAADSRPMPEFMAKDSYTYLGSEPLRSERYTSADFFRLEVERMWPNVWQMAAREEDIPDPGDVIVYENVGRSYLVARQTDGSVRAMHNVCLHRGRKLRTQDGWANDFQCPYHGFTWNLDGSLKDIPCRWDFGHLSDEKMKLPQAQVGRWGGYIFVKENPGGPSLEEYLSPLPEHFSRWKHEECTTTAWVGKIIAANYKAVMEAFMEAWHNYVTHPQITPFVGDANSRYNVLGEHINCAYSPLAVMSPQLDPRNKGEQWILDEFVKFNGRSNVGEGDDLTVGSNGTARKVLGQRAREGFEQLYGRNLDHATDAEVLDAIYYGVFPNFEPWGGFMPSLSYRFRPWPDQNRSLMEVRILTRVRPNEPIPRSVPMRLLGENEPWSSAPELNPALANVLEQDVTNVKQVQAGLKVSKSGEVNLGDYQEIRIRHFHQTLDKYLEKYR